MDPNLPPPQQQPTPLSSQPAPSSTGYLDSIAAQPTQPTMKPTLLWGLIAGVLLIVIIVGSFVAFGGGPSQSDRLVSFVQRIQALEKVSTDSSKSIQSSDLRALNGSMGTILTGAEQESAAPLAANGVKKLKPANKKSPITAEFVTLSSKLDDARLNVVFDRVYAREMAYQLGKLRAEIDLIYHNTKSKSLKAYLDKTDTNLKPLVSQFTNFNDSQS